MGKIFQNEKYKRNGGTSKSKISSDLHDAESSSESSDEEDSPRGLNYRTPLVTQVYSTTVYSYPNLIMTYEAAALCYHFALRPRSIHYWFLLQLFFYFIPFHQINFKLKLLGLSVRLNYWFSPDKKQRVTAAFLLCLEQGIGRLFRCLCNPAFDVDDDEIVYKGKWSMPLKRKIQLYLVCHLTIQDFVIPIEPGSITKEL